MVFRPFPIGRFLLMLCIALPMAVQAVDQAKQEAQLKQLKSEIAKLEKKLSAQTGQRSEALSELRSAEISISQLSRKISTLQKDIQSQDQTLGELQQDERRLEKRLAVHRASLVRQIRAAHRLGHRETLQLILNQEDPALLGRALNYAKYLNQARLKAINDAMVIARELNAVRAQTQQSRDRLANSRDNLLSEQQNLQTTRSKREALIKSLDQAIQAGGAKLAQLQADRQRLEELLRSLSELLADIPAAPFERQPFKTMRGKLPWPAKGQITNDFNDERAGDLRWRGLLITAPTGNNVRAVYYGQVVFADWLQGFGLITIIDHNDGYMSLYGHNETLLKETGDWVVPGDIIATVGSSGGPNASGVYFEIRAQGKPINPRRWISPNYLLVESGN